MTHRPEMLPPPEPGSTANGSGRIAQVVIGRLAVICLGVTGGIIAMLISAWMGWITLAVIDLKTQVASMQGSRRPADIAAAPTPAPKRQGGLVGTAEAAEQKR